MSSRDASHPTVAAAMRLTTASTLRMIISGSSRAPSAQPALATPSAPPPARGIVGWAGAYVIADPLRAATVGALVLGLLVRLAFVLSSDFPLNDGALFLAMARAVRASHYHLPATVAYNGVAIPFGYSPLGFYLVAALHDLLGLDMTQALRVLPLLATSACLVAFAAFARDVLPRVTAGVTRPGPALAGAVLAFALLPRSYAWLLMGGGLTRSLGFLFAILAIHQAFLLYTRGGWTHALLTGVFAGLTALSHLGTAPFTAASIALLFVAYARTRVAVLGSVVALVVAVLLAYPWVATVVGHHGWGPFLAARATGANVFDGGDTRWTIQMRVATFGYNEVGEPLFPLVTTLAFIGAIASARGWQFLLVAWFMMILAIDVRAPGTYASVPIALLAGVAISAVLWPLLFATDAPGPRDTIGAGNRRSRVAPWLVAGALFAYALGGAVSRNESLAGDAKLLRGLPRDERDAMAWVARATPPDARFLVITGPGHTGVWGDRVSEWFPVLAARTSLATIQGREWINDGTFKARESDYMRLQSCAAETGACLDAWSQHAGTTYSYVFVSKEKSFKATEPLVKALRTAPEFRVVYDGPGGFVAARRPPGAS